MPRSRPSGGDHDGPRRAWSRRRRRTRRTSGMIMFPARSPGPARPIAAADRGPTSGKSLAQITAFRATPVQMPTVGQRLQSSRCSSGSRTVTSMRSRRRAPDLPEGGARDPRADVGERGSRASIGPSCGLDRSREGGGARRPGERRRPTLEVMTGGIEISQFKRGVREFKVLAELARSQRDDPDDVTGIYVRAGDGRSGAAVEPPPRPRGHGTRHALPLRPIAVGNHQREPRWHQHGRGHRPDPEARGGNTYSLGSDRALPVNRRTLAEGTSALAAALLPVAPVRLPAALRRSSIRSWRRSRSCSPSRSRCMARLRRAPDHGPRRCRSSRRWASSCSSGLSRRTGILIVRVRAAGAEGGGTSARWRPREKGTLLRFRPILATVGGDDRRRHSDQPEGCRGRAARAWASPSSAACWTATALTLYVTPVVYATLASLRLRRRTVEVAAKVALRRLSSSATRGGASRGAHPRQRARDGARAEHRHPDCGGLRRQRRRSEPRCGAGRGASPALASTGRRSSRTRRKQA